MIAYLQANALWLILLLGVVALLLCCFGIWRKRRRKDRLERDRSGFWRYHKDSQFTLKAAYADQLENKKDATSDSEESEGSAVSSSSEKESPAIAVLQFEGDLRARQHETFAKLVDEVVVNRSRIKEVVVRIDSAGGMVAPYGHVYAEMIRLRELQVPLTVCIDVVAASGGYLAALPANRIVAAPFAIVGSVGVMAFVPNVRRFLTRWDIEPRTFTAGKYKRTVTLTDNATPEEVAHFQAQLEAVQRMFTKAVATYRPQAKLEHLETGDHWTAADSIELELGMVDELMTSSDYLLAQNKNVDLLYIGGKKSFWEDGLLRFTLRLVDSIEHRLVTLVGAGAS